MFESLATYVMIKICVVCLDIDITDERYIAPIVIYFFGWVLIPPTLPIPTAWVYFIKGNILSLSLRVC